MAYCFEERFVEIDGTRVCYVDEGAGEPILFVHGLGGSINNWTPNLQHFSRRNRVICLDLPGCGRSDFDVGDCGIEFFAGIIRGLLAELGVGRVTLVGNSLGGMISMHLALRHPDVMSSLVLVDSAGGHHFPRVAKWALRHAPISLQKRFIRFFAYVMPRYRIFYRIAGVYNVNEYSQAMIDYIVGMVRHPDLEGYLEAYARTARTAVETFYGDDLGLISKPTLIVWGQKDLGVPLKVGHKLNKAVRGSFLVAVPKAAHVPQVEQPEIFNAALERFLDGVRPEV